MTKSIDIEVKVPTIKTLERVGTVGCLSNEVLKLLSDNGYLVHLNLIDPYDKRKLPVRRYDIFKVVEEEIE